MAMAASNSSFLLPAVLLLSLLAGCTKPVGDYRFVSTETARTQNGRYDFTLALDDSTRSYTLALAARLVASRLPAQEITFEIHTTSPYGESTIERKTFPLQGDGPDRFTKGSGSVIDCEWILQDAFRASGAKTGAWQVSVSPTDTTLLAAIYGIGLSYEDNHGKR